MVAARFNPHLTPALVAALSTLEHVVAFLASKDPDGITNALSPPIELVVYPADRQPRRFALGIRHGKPVVVPMADGSKAACRITLTQSALEAWVSGRLDTKAAIQNRAFIVAGSALPLAALARALQPASTAPPTPPSPARLRFSERQSTAETPTLLRGPRLVTDSKSAMRIRTKGLP